MEGVLCDEVEGVLCEEVEGVLCTGICLLEWLLLDVLPGVVVNCQAEVVPEGGVVSASRV